MWIPPWAKAVAEPQKVDFVDGTQHLGHCALDYLIFQCRNPEGPLLFPVGLWNVGATYRLRPIASGVDSVAEVPDVGVQVLLVFPNRHPIHAGTRCPSLPFERPRESFVVNMVQQCREANLARTSRYLIHPGEFGWQRHPALRPVSRRPSQVPLGSGSSLWSTRFLRRRHQYYTPIRHPISAQPATPVVPCRRPPPVTKPEAPIGLPRFRRVPFMHEMAFDPGRAATPRIPVPFA